MWTGGTSDLKGSHYGNITTEGSLTLYLSIWLAYHLKNIKIAKQVIFQACEVEIHVVY